MSEQLQSADIQLIQRILPHRYPFLLVDKVVDIDGTTSARGIKNVTTLATSNLLICCESDSVVEIRNTLSPTTTSNSRKLQKMGNSR